MRALSIVPVFPLVGRGDELALAAAALAAPAQAGLVVVGEAGVGKSRLAEECKVLAEAAGFAVVSVMATRAAASIPLGALAPLLPSRLGTPDEGVDAVRWAAAMITAHAAERPLVVVVDDAHLLDDVSATVVHQLAGWHGVFVVATVRSDEAVPDPITALWKNGRAARLDLVPLGRREVELVAENGLGAPIEATLARELWRLSAGNALFLRELIVAGRDSGRLCLADGKWRLRGRLPTSARLVDLIGMRLGALEADERSALELVAFGEPIDARVIETLASAAAVEALEGRGLIKVEADGTRHELRLGHPLYGEVLRGRIPTVRRSRIHGVLADAVAANGLPRRDDILRVATWRLHDRRDHEPGLFVAGAREARAAGDLALAAQLAAAGHRAGGGVTALGMVASVTAEAGDPLGAEQLYAEAAREARTGAERALVAMGRSTNLFAGLGDEDGAFALDTQAVSEVVDPDWRDELVAHRATFDLLLGRPLQALDSVEHLLADRGGRPFVQAAIVAVPALVVAGRSGDANALADRAYAVHTTLGHQDELSHAAIHLVGKTFALREAGRIAEALSLAEFAHGAAIESGSTLGQAYFGVQLGGALLAAGRVCAAAAAFDESAVLMRDLGLPGRLRWSLAGAVLTHVLSGDLARSDRRLAELEANPSPERLLEGEVQRASAWNACAHGAVSRGRTILRQAFAEAHARGTAGLQLCLLHDLARLAPLGDASRPEPLLETVSALHGVQGALASVRRDHIAAVALGDGVALDEVAGAFAGLGANLLAADAAAQAARAHEGAGSRRQATASRQRAGQLAQRCEGASTPALGALGARDGLTEREGEIARLAADGLGNRAIAERLYVSVRTVENHLQHVYVKLGVAGRSGLGTALCGGAARV